ncbi:MAG: YcjX family protein [Rhizobiales bacterium]|nr:YcjX family protein [Hyphomicrobiales bacterium]MBI3672201.1 YcjX family protein [Hyphomicrobiales bacterium]
MKLSDVYDSGRLALGGLRDFASGLVHPTLRLGVTGLSRAGKTVFITALVDALLKGGRLPGFEAMADGRIARAYLEPQPDLDLPRFRYEDHLAQLTAEDRRWPEGTRQISQLRLTIEYTPRSFLARHFSSGRLHLDIVDYPGEWLLDLPLMRLAYAEWSAATLAASRQSPRLGHATDWHNHLKTLDTSAAADETQAIRAAELFTSYLAACRADAATLSALPPGRFLMPGDYAGSPLLAFAPLDVGADAQFARGSMGALMESRYQAYVARIVKPFFFGHFARLDRQVVLVEALASLNAGAFAVRELQGALAAILASFRQGANSLASELFGRRIDRILFAATKADLLHHESHDRLENILRLIVEDAARRAAFAGATVEVAAIAAIRATREAKVKQRRDLLDCIAGVPEAGETIGATRFDGATEAAIFPGDLPEDPHAALDGRLEGRLKFVRFRPPLHQRQTFPHIRLDRAIEFLIGDRLA